MTKKLQPTEKSKRVGIWIRVSTEDQAKGESAEHHEKRARYYAESKGWQVREVYQLEAVSGKSLMSQPETQRMLKDIRTGHIAGLIFSKLARLARNTKELLEFADLFREHETDLISLQESIDTSTPAGPLSCTVIAAMAGSAKKSPPELPPHCRYEPSSASPSAARHHFGYQWVNRKLEPHPEEAPVRKRIFELFLEHRRKKTEARGKKSDLRNVSFAPLSNLTLRLNR